MRRLAGTLVLLAAGFAVGVAWGDGAPIVVGGSTSTTQSSTTTTSSPVPAPIGLTPSASVSLSSRRAGARPVVMTLALHYEMQCGYPGSGSLVVKLPAQTLLPAAFVTGSALLDGKSVRVTLGAAKTLRVALPPRRGVMCDVIGPGTLTLSLTKTARLGNPMKAGAYSVSAQAGSRAFRTSFVITA